ncbi:MAG TPA: orotidine-5'-phosphate decarboxylase [Acidimicrobiia bacterium]|nr:orotidine-5'-phosphate decarboxylase [Acidimicrobiia bacterium]
MNDERATEEVRARLAVALDVPTLAEALDLAKQVEPWFGVAKVGMELFTAEGPRAVEGLRDTGLDVFYDAKYHDIPTTVGRAARVAGRLGIRYLNAHAAGGIEMLRAFAEGLAEGADDGGHAPPVALAVTVLTSDADASAFEARLATAVEAGCGGVVLSAHELERARAGAPGLLTVVPGIRPVGASRDDQARAATPGVAVSDGADVLVVGRPVTRADDVAQAAAAVAAEVAATLAKGSATPG